MTTTGKITIRKNTSIGVDVNYKRPIVRLSNTFLDAEDNEYVTMEFEGLGALTDFIRRLSKQIWAGVDTLTARRKNTPHVTGGGST